jgi:hypothetical protein
MPTPPIGVEHVEVSDRSNSGLLELEIEVDGVRP